MSGKSNLIPIILNEHGLFLNLESQRFEPSHDEPGPKYVDLHHAFIRYGFTHSVPAMVVEGMDKQSKYNHPEHGEALVLSSRYGLPHRRSVFHVWHQK